MKAVSGQFVVCEPTPRWACLLRRFDHEVDLVEARSLALARDALDSLPSSFVAIAAQPARFAATAHELAELVRDFPGAAFAVLLDEPDGPAEAGFLEVGAQLIIASPLDLPRVIRMARRHFALAPPLELDLRSSIAAKMPWR